MKNMYPQTQNNVFNMLLDLQLYFGNKLMT